MKTRSTTHCLRSASAGKRLCRFILTVIFVTFSPTLLTATEPASPAAIEAAKLGDPAAHHTVAERSGSLQTKDGLTLKLSADLGSVSVHLLPPQATPVVQYSVHLETDARSPEAERLLESYSLQTRTLATGVELTGHLPTPALRRKAPGAQFWVQFEVGVPAGFNLEIETGAGDIVTGEVGGTASLTTQGGNITAGRIGFSTIRSLPARRFTAKLSTGGGHIQVQDVAGDLRAFTAGGHINAGNVLGAVSLHSGGGHLRVGKIDGRAELQTDGGNVTVAQAGNFVNVRTGGGQIDFGEVRGSVQAQTGGGGIRMLYVSGPMEVASTAGSICLTRVAGPVHAATGEGSITAWISPDAASGERTVQLAAASQLASGNGDIVVYVPRNLAANIDALVTSGDERLIEADPLLHLTVQSSPNAGGGPVHAWTTLNGGGMPLTLRTSSGKIRLQFLDSEMAIRETRIRELQVRIKERISGELPELVPLPDLAKELPSADKSAWLENLLGKLEVAFAGGLREGPDEFQKRLLASPKPSYPLLAQRSGIQGQVKLQVRVNKDGTMEVLKLLSGEPVLADAAIAAVKQWRARPMYVDGQPLQVISTVTFDFQLK